jgi:hypothetical protein
MFCFSFLWTQRQFVTVTRQYYSGKFLPNFLISLRRAVLLAPDFPTVELVHRGASSLRHDHLYCSRHAVENFVERG